MAWGTGKFAGLSGECEIQYNPILASDARAPTSPLLRQAEEKLAKLKHQSGSNLLDPTPKAPAGHAPFIGAQMVHDRSERKKNSSRPAAKLALYWPLSTFIGPF
jgi:hypothetical protein